MSFFRLSVFVAVIAAFIYYYFFTAKIEEVILKTSLGHLRGFKSISRQGRTIHNFRAIPYAKPPVGELRFQPPVEYGKWEGVRDATIPVPICLQADTLWKSLSGQEDCLYLNVFTPEVRKSGKLLPVMVFIHGGHFMFGGSDLFGPHYFMDEEIVLVTINYRLGVLGFLNNGKHARGNMGLKDQVMALKWVKSAIADFGGDPNQVTIFGNSAGGASVNYHMISPASQGLFHRAISQSGSAFCPWAKVQGDPKAQARRLWDKLKCLKGSADDDFFRCINATIGLNIVKTQTECYDIFHEPEAIYGPSLEEGNYPDTFLTKSSYNYYKSGKIVSNVPWIVGVNSEDGCYRTGAFATDEQRLKEVHKNWESRIAPNALMYDEKANPDAAREILNQYFGNPPDTFTLQDYDTLTDIFSDRYFLNGVAEAARIQAEHSDADVYLYYYTHAGYTSTGQALEAAQGKYPVILELLASVAKNFISTKILNRETHNFGACHADELKYLFTTIPLWDIPQGSEDYEFSRDLVKLWTTFAKTGKPGKYLGTEWKKMSIDDRRPKYMHLAKSSNGMIEEPFTFRMEFWETLKL